MLCDMDHKCLLVVGSPSILFFFLNSVTFRLPKRDPMRYALRMRTSVARCLRAERRIFGAIPKIFFRFHVELRTRTSWLFEIRLIKCPRRCRTNLLIGRCPTRMENASAWPTILLSKKTRWRILILATPVLTNQPPKRLLRRSRSSIAEVRISLLRCRKGVNLGL